MRRDLIRSEALENRRLTWLGEAVITFPIGARIFCLLGAAIFVLIIAVLLLGSFTEKIHISGSLQPSLALVEVLASKPGVVVEQRVKEGAPVRAGEILFVVSTELSLPVGEIARGSSAEVLSTVQRLGRLVGEQAQATSAVNEIANRKMAEGVKRAEQELEQLATEIELQKSQVQIAEQAYAIYRQIRDQGFISDLGLNKSKTELLTQQAKLISLGREKTRLLKEIETARDDVRIGSWKAVADQLASRRDLAAVKKDEIAVSAQREFAVVAPCDGKITSVNIRVGQQTGTQVLAAIIPTGSRMEGVAWVQSDLAPFLAKGQRASLKFTAFPYQRYGQMQGKILEVSRSETHESALRSDRPERENISTYRVRVELDSQVMTTADGVIPLGSGLNFDAAVHLIKRPLYEMFLPNSMQLRSK